MPDLRFTRAVRWLTSSQGWVGRVDAVTLLSIYLAVSLFIPSQLVVRALGSAGSLSVIGGLGLLAWWILDNLRDPEPTIRRNPILIGLATFLLLCLLSHAIALTRPISVDELNASRNGLLMLAGWCGVAAVTGDCTLERARLERLIRTFGVIAAMVGLLVIVQFITAKSWVDLVTLPGFAANHPISSSAPERSGFVRPAGTAIHPIELGVILAAALPFQLYSALYSRALYSRAQSSLIVRWWPATIGTLALMLSLSRSTAVALAIIFAVLLPTWPRVWRLWGALAIAAGTVFVYLTTPGFLGTLVRLFTGVSDDASAQSRTDSYTLAFDFVRSNPIIGRGFMTFLPKYRILDNQYLGLLIDVGVLGVVAFVGTLVVAIVTCIAAYRAAPGRDVRHLASAAVAAIVACTFDAAIFDLFSFPMGAAMTFFCLGLCIVIPRVIRADLASTAVVAEPGRKVAPSHPLPRLHLGDQRDSHKDGQ